MTEPPCPTEPIPSPSNRTPDRTRAGSHAGQGVAAGRTEPGPSCAASGLTLVDHPVEQLGRPSLENGPIGVATFPPTQPVRRIGSGVPVQQVNL